MYNNLVNGGVYHRTIAKFNFNIAAIFILCVVNIIYRIKFSTNGIECYANPWNPIWLLFGPLTYFSNLTSKGIQIAKNAWIHFVPFVFFFSYYFVISLTTKYQSPLLNPLYVDYENSFIVISISLMSYSVKIILDHLKYSRNLSDSDELVLVTTIFYIMISLLYLLMYFCWKILFIDMVIDYRFFTYGLLFVISVFIIRYFYVVEGNIKSINVEISTVRNYANSKLTAEQIKSYGEQIDHYFVEKRVFLRPDLSLAIVSEDLGIPKYICSQVFNVYLGKNFYNYVADHRISHIIEKFDTEYSNMKIESLAYECGFNSKTSFNRYFKEKTGQTPLQYIEKKVLEREGAVL